MTDIFSRDKRSQIMSKVRNKNTNIELILRKKLWNLGFRYRIHYKIIGTPDIVFPCNKVAIFCDGDFWHGHNYSSEYTKYSKFWRKKISGNIERDKEVNKKLKTQGWTVIRLWKTEILKKPNICIKKITKILREID